MNVGLYRGAIAMASQQKQLDTIAGNLANVGTTGYKRDVAALSGFRVQRRYGAVEGLRSEVVVDFSQGEIVRTGRDLDLALDGEGYFAVEGPDGEVYTRNGGFHLTAEGVLVSDQGFPAAWEKRSKSIDAAGLPVLVGGDGTVRQGVEELGRLKIVNFADAADLRRDPGGNWTAPAGAREAAHTARVHQGALELSNTTGIEEMVEMIQIQRSFDSVSRVLSSIDQTYRRLTRPF